MIPPDLRSIICGSDGAAEVGQRSDVEVDHLALALRVELGKAADQAETGVVDEELDGLAVRLDVGHQLGRGIRLRQIDRHRPGVAELLGQLVEPLLAPRGKDQPMAALRQLARELDSKAGRRAGDERDLVHAQLRPSP